MQNLFANDGNGELSLRLRVRRIGEFRVQAYRGGVGMAPIETVAGVANAEIAAPPPAIDGALLEELWQQSGAANWGLEQSECNRILLEAGRERNYGLEEGVAASENQRAAFFRGLCLADLVLARACAHGIENAWEHFVASYRPRLVRAAFAITGSETLGRDLADQLYAELYGLTVRDGERRCPLHSYRGRGSLMGWLRTTLAQRHVDHHRRTHREEPMDEYDAPAADAAPQTPDGELLRLKRATEDAVKTRDAEERYLLAAYFLDGQTLLQIAGILGVHEATVSRKLRRATEGIRKQVLRNLQLGGMSRRAAEEALGVDPRDLDVNLKRLLQPSQTGTFKEQAGA